MDDDLWQRASRQHGLLTTDDLRQHLTWKQRAGLVERGLLLPIGATTFAVAGAPSTDHQRVLARCFEAKGSATEGTAAWLHGIGGFGPGDPPSVVAREQIRDYRVPVTAVHSSTNLRPRDIVVVDGIPTMNVARTLFSLAAAVPRVRHDDVANAIDEAVRDRKGSDGWFRSELERIRCRGRNGVKVFEAILDARADAPTESALERRFLALAERYDLPRPLVQARVRRGDGRSARVDFLYATERLVIEVTGHATHSTVLQRADDARRRNGLAASGLYVVEFTYQQVEHDADYVADVTRDLVLLRRRRTS